VEYKIFGPAQEAPADFKENLQAFFRLDGQQRDVIADWFLSAHSYDLYETNLPP
jgi:hypothetical protein